MIERARPTKMIKERGSRDESDRKLNSEGGPSFVGVKSVTRSGRRHVRPSFSGLSALIAIELEAVHENSFTSSNTRFFPQ